MNYQLTTKHANARTHKFFAFVCFDFVDRGARHTLAVYPNENNKYIKMCTICLLCTVSIRSFFFLRFACIANGMFYIHVCLFVLYINALGRKYWGLTRHMHISVVCLQQIFHWNWKTWAHTTFGAFSMFDLTDGGAQIRNSEVLQTFCWLPILWINDCQARIWIILSHFAASHKLNIER